MERREIFCFNILVVALGILQADDLCPKDGVYPVPGDCSRYIQCTNGKAVVLPCPGGLLYNINLGVCDYASNVVCESSIMEIEEQLNEIFTSARQSPRPMTSHWQTYGPLTSRNTYGPLTSRNTYGPLTSRNTYGPLTSRQTTHATEGTQQTTRKNEEAECTTGALTSHLKDCAVYFVCSGGRNIEFNCPPGTYFSSRLHVCTADISGCDAAKDSEIRKPSRPIPVRQVVNESTGRSPSYGSSNMGEIMDNLEEIKDECRDWTLSLLRQEAEVASRTGSTESQKPFRRVQGFMGATQFVKQISFSGIFQSRMLQIIKERYRLTKDQLKNAMNSIGRVLRFDVNSLAPIMKSSPEPTDCPFPPHSKAECDQNQRFRTIDGTCNNLNNPLWGRSFRPLRRLLESDYADGIEAPRVSSQGSDLPSARVVSLNLFKVKDNPDPVHTVLLMTWGQFLDHDLSRTAMTKLNTRVDGRGTLVDVECGRSGCETEGVENRPCLPIAVPQNDPDFPHKKCLMFVRSEASPSDSCKIGPREQLNQLTSYLDASMVYGSTAEDSMKLRDTNYPDRGILKIEGNPTGHRSLLPHFDDKGCREITPTVRCFTAGEGRVNEQVGLMVVHTIYHRYHNVIEERLHRINPHWSGDRLFEETRRIIGALWQHQVFNEYLPIVLGPQVMQQYGLNLAHSGYWNGYDSSVNPEVANAFATAAFRFAHSSIPDNLNVVNSHDQTENSSPMSKVLMRPTLIYQKTLSGESPIDSILRGQYNTPMQVVDEHFTKQITAKLFSPDPPNAPGTDLISLNIQRGREHGLKGYTAWRKFCGLSVPKSFQDMTDIPEEIRQRLQRIFKDVDDVDLFPAAISERHVPGGVVGPTFACIIGQQFRNLRVGDRFWYERQNRITGFSLEQVNEIKKTLISRIVCETSDDIDSVQPYVMLQPVSKAFKNMGRQSYQTIYSLASLYRGNNNEKSKCSQIPDIDLMKWKE